MSDKRGNIPTVLVVLGATGDLMTKKIIPALFNLHEKKELPSKFHLVGVSRRAWSDEDLQNHIRTILEVKAPHARRASVESFLKLAAYHKLEFDMAEDYAALNGVLKKIDDRWGVCTNKLFYLSVPPQFYQTILGHLHKSHLTDGCGPEEGWTRVIVEKPFGSDEKTAKALDEKLAKLFKEEQIYRIDHYPAKEMLQNLLLFRFANDLFENNWSNASIESINLRLFEKIGAEDRGLFYDHVGALRDMGQNHHLQMLALITMERPARYDAVSIRSAREALFKSLVIPSVTQAAAQSFRAQYEGYRSIKGVAPDSKTETFFRVTGFLSGARWEGVPVVMESGKRLGEPLKEIEIVMRHMMPCLCPPGGHVKNRIMVRMEPQEGITLTFHSKKPGHAFEMEERLFHFDFRENGGAKAQYTEEYEKLLLDCIAGDQTLFVSSGEIAAMWRFVDPFLLAWKKDLVPLKYYVSDSRAIVAEAEAHDLAMRSAFDGVKRGSTGVLRKEIGIFGLGKMGANVARQLHEKGWRVVASNRSSAPIDEIRTEGVEGAYSPEELVQSLSSGRASGPRIVWVMITAGKSVDAFLFGRDGIAHYLKKGDIVIDAGNSLFEDSMRRAKLLAKKGIRFADVGFSGGPSGARNGGSLMVGGDKKTFEYLEPLFADLSVRNGFNYFGEAGAGHFVKMVHNGIEYGMMQSLAEGFALMKRSPFKLDLKKIADVYNHGSVIESRLVGWLGDAFREYGEDLKPVSGSVAYTGEGEWTLKTGKKWGMKLPAIQDSFQFRVRSKKSPSYTGRLLSAMRNRFGGHSIGGDKTGTQGKKNKKPKGGV